MNTNKRLICNTATEFYFLHINIIIIIIVFVITIPNQQNQEYKTASCVVDPQRLEHFLINGHLIYMFIMYCMIHSVLLTEINTNKFHEYDLIVVYFILFH